MKVLVVEDNHNLLQAAEAALTSSGFLCEIATDFKSASEKILLYTYDVVVVDINLPDGSGLDLIRVIKEVNTLTGVIIISARNSLDNKIEGLYIGADDYITKPFDMAELVARLKSLFRRRKYGGNNFLTQDNIQIDTNNREVQVNGHIAELTRSEYEILLFLMSNPGRVLTRESIAEHIWGDNMDMIESFDFIYSHIKNLRKKLIALGTDDPVIAVYGVGYKLKNRITN
jgi:DNA-binding response OmpR family regulator